MKIISIALVLFFFVGCGVGESPDSQSSLKDDTDPAELNETIRTQYSDIEARVVDKKQSLSEQEIDHLYDLTYNHAIAGLNYNPRRKNYDPEGRIGFCFGRAMTVYLIASRMGLARDSMRKFFIIGDMRSGVKREWRFHVTTVVKNEAGEWIAVDPIRSQPMPINQWIGEIQGIWDRSHKARFFLASPDAVLPDIRSFIAIDEDGVPMQPETGDRILELSFDPDSKSGFTPMPTIAPNVWQLTEEASSRYFRAVHSPEDDRASFLSITINGGTPTDYNDYFQDLVKDLFAAEDAIFQVMDVVDEAG